MRVETSFLVTLSPEQLRELEATGMAELLVRKAIAQVLAEIEQLKPKR